MERKVLVETMLEGVMVVMLMWVVGKLVFADRRD